MYRNEHQGNNPYQSVSNQNQPNIYNPNPGNYNNSNPGGYGYPNTYINPTSNPQANTIETVNSPTLMIIIIGVFMKTDLNP